eukprot:CAMPEP_0172745802 /NCGR_PEP_ID=MMETSP1074-20121228/138869_1 /TAXON_ID=2916 /ORGANISM="Ceratium fusus, Strain PA161109" /LENGTH=107 /DNA_ID=CAMNT_0013577055 /DNA_START=294 /DNA_END=614 /DNA_ORIENTATION=-
MTCSSKHRRRVAHFTTHPIAEHLLPSSISARCTASSTGFVELLSVLLQRPESPPKTGHPSRQTHAPCSPPSHLTFEAGTCQWRQAMAASNLITNHGMEMRSNDGATS